MQWKTVVNAEKTRSSWQTISLCHNLANEHNYSLEGARQLEDKSQQQSCSYPVWTLCQGMETIYSVFRTVVWVSSFLYSPIWFCSFYFQSEPYLPGRVWQKIYCLQRKWESSIKKTSQDRYIEYVHCLDLTREENGKQLVFYLRGIWEQRTSQVLHCAFWRLSNKSTVWVERANKSGFYPHFCLYESEPGKRPNIICTRFSLPPGL